VRLRSGGRIVGGAMSWGDPKSLAPFNENSPFFGLPVQDDITVSAQVMAQPDPTLSDRVIAELSDGTPLVTRKTVEKGQIIFFHVTANAEWSTLPLSGLFVQMLERLAISSNISTENPEDLQGTTWVPITVIGAYGRITAAQNLIGVDGSLLLTDPIGPKLQAGLYQGAERIIARNIIAKDDTIAPMSWPSDVPIKGLVQIDEIPLGGWLLMGALMIMVLDIFASLAVSGRLRVARLMLFGLLFLPLPDIAKAQDVSDAAAEIVLAHVITGDSDVDNISQAGLRGLSDVLFFRTSVEPANPKGIDLERDELSLYPIIYWPITLTQNTPSLAAYDRLNAYLRSGGMIVFDTRDANITGSGGTSPQAQKLQVLARPLDIPPLEPVPADHILTRTFYLLQEFPGRHLGRSIWVEAAPKDAEKAEGMPFRNLNDGVTPVIIGGNDWAGAWAVGPTGNPLLPVGRGFTGERQRELAYRFGVNLVMHVLTGNYKSDQVHVPALLNRLGQ